MSPGCSDKLQRSRRAGRPQGRARPKTGCTWGHRQGLERAGVAHSHPALLQSIPVHWTSPPRGRGVATVTSVATAPWDLPSEPQEGAPKSP